MDGAKMKRDEILAIYAAGPDAMVGLVERLLARQAVLEQQVETLTARVQALEARLNKDSHNSHKPPSSDGLAKLPPRRSRRRHSGKRPGGQAGHVGVTLRPVAEPTQVVPHAPGACPACGADLTAVEPVIRERRQVVELPPLKPVVIEHQVLQARCPHCQHLSAGQFPPEVTQPVQYGPGVQALAIYFQEYQHLPFARLQEVFRDAFQLPLSAGTLAQARERCATRLAGVAARIKQAVTQAPVVNVDETGLRVAGQTHWLHVASTPSLTYYAVHPKRGQKAMHAIGLLPAFSGTAVHDALPAYLAYACHHSLCNAHLLRDLTAASEVTDQPWPQQMAQLLLTIKAAVEHARSAGQLQLPPECVHDFVTRYQQLIETALPAHPAPPPVRGRQGRQRVGPLRSLLLRLQTYQTAVLAFMHDFAVPFDNNLAERDLRMAKVRQKIAGGFRSGRGADCFAILRGYISTLRKQHTNVLAALNSVFAGQPLIPRLTPE
jgi:transposase